MFTNSLLNFAEYLMVFAVETAPCCSATVSYGFGCALKDCTWKLTVNDQ